MFIKESKLDKLLKNIDELNFILTKNNLIELAEILGNRKELLIRNLISRNCKRNRNWYWFFYTYCNIDNNFTKNSNIKYTSYRRLY